MYKPRIEYFKDYTVE